MTPCCLEDAKHYNVQTPAIIPELILLSQTDPATGLASILRCKTSEFCPIKYHSTEVVHFEQSLRKYSQVMVQFLPSDYFLVRSRKYFFRRVKFDFFLNNRLNALSNYCCCLTKLLRFLKSRFSYQRSSRAWKRWELRIFGASSKALTLRYFASLASWNFNICFKQTFISYFESNI